MPTPQPPRDNPRAEHAFADYVALGSSRSLAILADAYRSCPDPAPTKHLRTLKEWSVKYGWQVRIAEAVSAEADAKLQEAAHLDADTFFATSRLLNERVHLATSMMADLVVKVRESVRKPLLKGGAVDINVQVTLGIRQLAERVAAEDGLDADEVIREAERLVAGVSA